MRPAAKNNPRPVQTLLLSLGSLESDSLTAGKTVSARCKSPSTRPGDGGFNARHAVSSRRGSHTHTVHTHPWLPLTLPHPFLLFFLTVSLSLRAFAIVLTPKGISSTPGVTPECFKEITSLPLSAYFPANH